MLLYNIQTFKDWSNTQRSWRAIVNYVYQCFAKFHNETKTCEPYKFAIGCWTFSGQRRELKAANIWNQARISGVLRLKIWKFNHVLVSLIINEAASAGVSNSPYFELVSWTRSAVWERDIRTVKKELNGGIFNDGDLKMKSKWF